MDDLALRMLPCECCLAENRALNVWIQPVSSEQLQSQPDFGAAGPAVLSREIQAEYMRI